MNAEAILSHLTTEKCPTSFLQNENTPPVARLGIRSLVPKLAFYPLLELLSQALVHRSAAALVPCLPVQS